MPFPGLNMHSLLIQPLAGGLVSQKTNDYKAHAGHALTLLPRGPFHIGSLRYQRGENHCYRDGKDFPRGERSCGVFSYGKQSLQGDGDR